MVLMRRRPSSCNADVFIGSDHARPQTSPHSVGGPRRELMLTDVQAGVVASRNQIRRRGPECAD
eukprot:1657622-Alexandrium_andersonii.AAC.1